MTGNKAKVLGKLTRVDLRDFWDAEARDFTPWLSEEENLGLLGTAIGLELELVGREQWVGSFKVDLLARDTVTNRLVVIENQLERTNHGHLGQLLTYGAGFDAIAVVWIAKNVCEEHRKALDWLNEKTAEDLAFFGLEVELWQIEDSKAAPKFNVVSQPNDWARAVRPGRSNVQEHTETKLLQREFWERMIEHFESKDTFLSMRKAQPQHWYDVGIGRSNFHISLTVNSKEKKISCGLYLSGATAKAAFSQLSGQKEAIEKEIGAKLDWRMLPDRQACRIVLELDADFENKQSWPKLFDWFKDRTEKLHRVFSSRVASLDLDTDENVA